MLLNETSFLISCIWISLCLSHSNALPQDSAGQHKGTGTASIPRVKRQSHVRNGAAAKARVFGRMGWRHPEPPTALGDTIPQQNLPANPRGNAITTGPVGPSPSPGLGPATGIQTSTSSSSAAATGTGSVNAIPQFYYSEYLALIEIGGQTMQVDFDTGSSDFWVFNTFLPPELRAGHQYVYNSTQSPTYRNKSSLTWAIEYGDESMAEGVVGQDVVKVGDLKITDQSIELATNVSQEFVDDTPNDGLIGMGFANVNDVRPVRQRTLFENMIPLLRKPVFVANLVEDGSGTFDFGFVNQSLVPKGEVLTTVPVNPTYGFWMFNSSVYGIGGNVTNRGTRASPAIADSGTSLLLLDIEVAEAFWKQVPSSIYVINAGGWVFRCDEQLPDISIAIGNVGPKGGKTNKGVMIHVPGWMLTFSRVGTEYCYGAVQSNNGYGLQVFGDILFRNAVVAFHGNRGNPSLGVAQKKVVQQQSAMAG